MAEHYDVILIGGGVIGCSIAYRLAKSGVRVVILEKNRISSEASGAAAGILGAQAEIDEEGPLLEFAMQSRGMFTDLVKELREETGIDVELIQKGLIKPARSEKEAERLKEKTTQHQRWDSEVSWLTADEAVRIEPALSPFLAGAMHIPNDGQLNPLKLTEALSLGAAYHGADIKEYCEVRSVIYERGEVRGVETTAGIIYGEKVVITTGAWAKQLAVPFLPEVDVYPVKGECVSVTTKKLLFSRTIFLDEGLYLVPKAGGRIIIGATKIPRSFDKSVSADGVLQLLQKAKEIVPQIEETSFEQYWAGLRPQTADGLPYLGEHEAVKGLYMSFGHFRNGILLSAATGKFMADFIQGRPVSSYFLNAFRLQRHHLIT